MTPATDPDTASVPEPPPAAAEQTQTFVQVYLVDLHCLACGRDAGLLETQSWQCASPVLFRPTGAHDVLSIPDWRRLRCDVCNGNVYADEIHSVRVYPALSPDELDVPR